MTERDEDRGGEGRDLPEARRGRRRRLAWVWIVPVAALAFAGWLAAGEWAGESEKVTVRFDEAQGLGEGAALRYKGVTVGQVERVGLTDDLQGVEVVLEVNAPASRGLGEGARFWIESAQPLKGELRGLVAGPHVAMRPADGPARRSFEGLKAPPPLEPDAPGRSFVLTAGEGDGLSPGAPVLFHGVEVGRVLDVRLADSRRGVEIRAFVEQAHADLVRRESVFWRAGGVSLSMSEGLSVSVPPLSALAAGGVAFSSPERFGGPPAEAGAAFVLYDGRDAAAAASGGARFSYRVRFPKAVGGLSRGAAVTLGGRRVGHVAEVELEVDPQSGKLRTVAGISLRAPAFDVTADDRGALREKLNGAIAQLIRDGFRAQVASGGFLSGGKSVELVKVGGAEKAELDRSATPPVIPAVSPDEG